MIRRATCLTCDLELNQHPDGRFSDHCPYCGNGLDIGLFRRKRHKSVRRPLRAVVRNAVQKGWAQGPARERLKDLRTWENFATEIQVPIAEVYVASPYNQMRVAYGRLLRFLRENPRPQWQPFFLKQPF